MIENHKKMVAEKQESIRIKTRHLEDLKKKISKLESHVNRNKNLKTKPTQKSILNQASIPT